MTTERTPTELLVEAREFISDPKQWCMGKLALDAAGKVVAGTRLIDATRCCGVGAVGLVACRRGMGAYAEVVFKATDLLDRAAIRLHPISEVHDELCPAAYVNDNLGHEAILRVYDAAIAASQDTTT